jgi:hypothetical protein
MFPYGRSRLWRINLTPPWRLLHYFPSLSSSMLNEQAHGHMNEILSPENEIASILCNVRAFFFTSTQVYTYKMTTQLFSASIFQAVIFSL